MGIPEYKAAPVVNDEPNRLASKVKRARNILAALIAAADMDAVAGPPGWKVHQLKGNRGGTWSISVSENWRPTFDLKKGEICNLNLKDYH